MRKLILFMMVFIFVFVQSVNVLGEDISIKGEAGILYDSTNNEVLWEKNSNKRMAPASLIKLLNVLTVMPYVDLDEVMTVGDEVSKIYNGQLLNLEEGDQMKIRDLFHGLLLWSANDGAVALGQYLCGDTKLHAGLMDKKAFSLGCLNTKSVNVNGYSDKDQYSTAYDLALHADAILSDCDFRQIITTKTYNVQWTKPEKMMPIKNTNSMLWQDDDLTGVKTGTTIMAGKCLILSKIIDDRELIAVVLNSSDRYGDCKKVLEYKE